MPGISHSLDISNKQAKAYSFLGPKEKNQVKKQINHINAFKRPLKNSMDKSKSSSTETNIYCAAHMKSTIQSTGEINASLQSKLM